MTYAAYKVVRRLTFPDPGLNKPAGVLLSSHTRRKEFTIEYPVGEWIQPRFPMFVFVDVGCARDYLRDYPIPVVLGELEIWKAETRDEPQLFQFMCKYWDDIGPFWCLRDDMARESSNIAGPSPRETFVARNIRLIKKVD